MSTYHQDNDPPDKGEMGNTVTPRLRPRTRAGTAPPQQQQHHPAGKGPGGRRRLPPSPTRGQHRAAPAAGALRGEADGPRTDPAQPPRGGGDGDILGAGAALPEAGCRRAGSGAARRRGRTPAKTRASRRGHPRAAAPATAGGGDRRRPTLRTIKRAPAGRAPTRPQRSSAAAPPPHTPPRPPPRCGRRQRRRGCEPGRGAAQRPRRGALRQGAPA
ncbi:proline-rich proteoglycan 2-like [Harpia harpyja]|uniref:proline-rich proteoglycan 2-like n=1 Tax=Harpia harpyja TaxID=202280 RepID=UPI0022B175FF|nr:proline-rich proteoglycan 2-like [Harpia harpyja]